LFVLENSASAGTENRASGVKPTLIHAATGFVAAPSSFICPQTDFVGAQMNLVCPQMDFICGQMNLICAQMNLVCGQRNFICAQMKSVCAQTKFICAQMKAVCEQMKSICGQTGSKFAAQESKAVRLSCVCAALDGLDGCAIESDASQYRLR
jgi:hypothetical protein